MKVPKDLLRGAGCGFLSMALILILSAPLVTAQDQVGIDEQQLSAPKKVKDRPVLVSITVIPNKLDRNKINDIKLKISFQDEGRNLRGGTLELQICDDGSSCVGLTIDLDKAKYGRKKGKDKIKTSVFVGDTDWMEFKAWLRDAGGRLSQPKKFKVPVTAASDDGDDNESPAWGTKLGERAIDFTLKDQNGRAVSLHDYSGSVILVDFSPQYCGPCQQEAAEAEQLYQLHKNSGFTILTVLFQDYKNGAIDTSECKAWADMYGLTFPVLADVNETVYRAFAESPNVPLNIIIDRNLVIRYKVYSYNKEELEAKVAELVAEAPAVVIDSH
ncbi:MAG TPA: TlpA disulfide reductase family protein [Acidobacteriota bacterium]|nr:TlpA disulfide reductase family protein [Acidobacteriota bacterium]